LFARELEQMPQFSSREELEIFWKKCERKAGERYVLCLLAQRSHLSSELVRKLRLKGISGTTILEVVEWCKERGFLEDVDLLKRWIAAEIKRGRSPRQIQFYLMTKKGVDPDRLSSLFSPELEREALECYLARRERRGAFEKKKEMQKLLRLGFSFDLIRERFVYN
jgi:SOS response regulatory protein OraA/RecX